MIELTQKLALECAECGRELRHIETLGTVQQTGTIMVVPCECTNRATHEITLRDGVKEDSGKGYVLLLDEYDTRIEVSTDEPRVEIMWIDESGNARESKGQACHPRDLLNAIELAGWTRERLEVFQ
jgi:hypothetical protein